MRRPTTTDVRSPVRGDGRARGVGSFAPRGRVSSRVPAPAPAARCDAHSRGRVDRPGGWGAPAGVTDIGLGDLQRARHAGAGWPAGVRPDGSLADIGDEVATGTTVSQAIEPLPDGWYVMAWSIVSEDGHVVHGSATFAVGDADAAARPSASILASTLEIALWLTRGPRTWRCWSRPARRGVVRCWARGPGGSPSLARCPGGRPPRAGARGCWSRSADGGGSVAVHGLRAVGDRHGSCCSARP